MTKPKANNNLATKDDIKKITIKLRQFATKEDLKRLGWRLEDKIRDLKSEFNGKLTKLKSDILDGVDRVYKEVVAMRQEQKVHQSQHKRIDETLGDHEGRLKTLETP